jgi:hypothetical protein
VRLLSYIFAFLLCLSSLNAEKVSTGQYSDGEKPITLNSDVSLNQKVVVLSNNTIMWLDSNAEIHFYAKGLEHVIDSNDYYLTLGVQIGDVYFKLSETPPDTSVMMVVTPSAELEIHSSEFSVESIVIHARYVTIVRCYSGYIDVTNPTTFAVTRIENNQASITGNNDEKNSSVLTKSIDQREVEKWKTLRATNRPPDQVKFNVHSTLEKSPPA